MARIDLYLSHLVRHDAEGIVLSSGSPVTFRFPTGERHSNTPVDHAQVAQLVQEIAPRDALTALMRTGAARFSYTSGDGITVAVDVEAREANAWRVTITPGDAAPAAPAAPAGGRRASHRPPSGAKRASVRPPPAAAVPAASHAAAAVAAKVHHEAQPGDKPIDTMLRLMVKLGASDLHLSPGERPMIRQSGEMRPLDDQHGRMTDAQLRELLMPIITPKARDDFEQTNDADFAHLIEGLSRFRANYFLERRGMGAVFRQIPFSILSPEQLGLSKHVLDLCNLSKGLVLVTGPTGSGKSTTLATLIDVINRTRADHIITIEDPIEFVHESKKCLVNQREIGNHTKDFKSALRAALREDPDIVLVGEMRDLETIAIAIETAETGHLVFGTLHTTTAMGTVDRIIDQFPADRQSQIRTMLSESFRGVIAQMLCRKVGGGRVAAYEVLLGTPAVANLIREGKTFQLASIMQTGKNLGMQTMNDNMLELVKAGTVEPREAYLKSNDKKTFKEMLAANGLKLEP